MNIIILDDYQDAVRKLRCASKLEALAAKVYTNTVKGIGQLSVRLRDADVLVLIRERTHFPRALLEKLPKLKLIAQTGRVGPHIDVETCTRLGIAVAEGAGSPVAAAELTWALVMAAMRRLPNYIATLKLTPITDGDRTFAEWTAEFDCDPEREKALADQIGNGVFQAGFDALKRQVPRR